MEKFSNLRDEVLERIIAERPEGGDYDYVDQDGGRVHIRVETIDPNRIVADY